MYTSRHTHTHTQNVTISFLIKYQLVLFFFAGRINLVDLQQIIGVDFSHIESKANELVKGDGNLYLQLGQLIDT